MLRSASKVWIVAAWSCINHHHVDENYDDDGNDGNDDDDDNYDGSPGVIIIENTSVKAPFTSSAV